MNWIQSSRSRADNDGQHQSHLFFEQQRKSKQLERFPPLQQAPHLGHAHPSIPVAAPPLRHDAVHPIRGISPTSSRGSSESPHSIFSIRRRHQSTGPSNVQENTGPPITLSSRNVRFQPGRASVSPVDPHRLPSHGMNGNHQDARERDRGRPTEGNRAFNRSPGPMLKFLRRESPNLLDRRPQPGGPPELPRKPRVLCPETPFFERQSQMQKKKEYDPLADIMIPETPATSVAAFSPRRVERDFDERSDIGREISPPRPYQKERKFVGDDVVSSTAFPKERTFEDKDYFDFDFPEPLPSPESVHLSQESIMSVDTYTRIKEDKEKKERKRHEIELARSMKQSTKSQQEKPTTTAKSPPELKFKQIPAQHKTDANLQKEEAIKPPAKRSVVEPSPKKPEKAKRRKEELEDFSTQSLKKLDKFLPGVEDFGYVPKNTIKANEETLLQLLSTYVSSGAFKMERKQQFEKLGIELGYRKPGSKFFLSEEEEEEFVNETVEEAAAMEAGNEKEKHEDEEETEDEEEKSVKEEEKENVVPIEEEKEIEYVDAEMQTSFQEEEEEETKEEKTNVADAEMQTSFEEEKKEDPETVDAEIQTSTQPEQKKSTADAGLQTEAEKQISVPVSNSVCCGHQQEWQKTNELLGSMLLTQETMLLTQKTVVTMLELLAKKEPQMNHGCSFHQVPKSVEKLDKAVSATEDEVVSKEVEISAVDEDKAVTVEEESEKPSYVVEEKGESQAGEVELKETALEEEAKQEETVQAEEETDEAGKQDLVVDEKEATLPSGKEAVFVAEEELAVVEEKGVEEGAEKENETPEINRRHEMLIKFLLDEPPKIKRSASAC